MKNKEVIKFLRLAYKLIKKDGKLYFMIVLGITCLVALFFEKYVLCGGCFILLIVLGEEDDAGDPCGFD